MKVARARLTERVHRLLHKKRQVARDLSARRPRPGAILNSFYLRINYYNLATRRAAPLFIFLITSLLALYCVLNSGGSWLGGFFY